MSHSLPSVVVFSCKTTTLLTRSVLLLMAGMLVLSSALSAQQPANQINNLRLWQSPDKTRVVFDVSENINYTVFSLSSPERLVIDIKNGGLKVALPIIDADNPHLRGVRSGSPIKGVLRFVFELKKPLDSHSFVLTPNELYGYRLVLDLVEKQSLPLLAAENIVAQKTSAAELESNDSSEPETTPSIIEPPVFAATRQSNLEQQTPIEKVSAPTKQTITIAIDPGHGGEDPGATGHRGSREKTITLSIAKHLLKVINADSRMQAFLVREGDYYIDLTRRRTMAREKDADIFVSIHADAFTKKSANGLSVFALSQRGATSAMARALAKKENAADLIGGVSLADKDAVLAKVLIDLSMTNTISESVNLGGRVLKELAKVGRLHSKRVEQAAFVVLKSPDIPSILIETGFITNLAEEKKLRTTRYQKKIANAVHRALGEYYDQTPYYNQSSYSSTSVSSWPNKLASNSEVDAPKQYKVKSGDSLSGIAFRHGTTVAELKRINRLSNDIAVLGQRLKIPISQSSQQISVAIHIVRRGDSLSKISARYNVTINALKRANSISKDTVYLGQKLKIPGADTTQKALIKHRVKRGDTLSEIAAQYGVTTKSVKLANGLRGATVQLGQTLKIPR